MPIAVLGFLGPRCPVSLRKTWNDALRSLYGDSVFFDFYRTSTVLDLEKRLSEMFVLQRCAYCIDASLSGMIVPFLDRLDASFQPSSFVDTVINEDGVLVGYSSGHGLSVHDLAIRLRTARLTCDFSYSSS